MTSTTDRLNPDRLKTVRPARNWQLTLLSSTALFATVFVFTPQAAQAQDVSIEGGDEEIVDGDGPGAGTPPSTQDSDWTIAGDLFVGGLTDGTLIIRNGGTVSSFGGSIGRWDSASGAVTVTGAGSRWDSGTSLYVGEGGTGTLTLADDGEVTTDSLNLASNADSTGTLTFGAAAGDNAAAAGRLDAATLRFGSGDGTIVFNHTDNDFELDANISGEGTVRQLAGTTTLSGDSTYTGETIFDGGTLALGSDTALGASTLTVTGAYQEGDPTLRADGAARTINNDIVFDRPDALPFAAHLNIAVPDHALTLNGDISGPGITRISGSAGVTMTGNAQPDSFLSMGADALLRAEGGLFGNIGIEGPGSVLELGDGVSASSSIFAVSEGFTLRTAEGENATLDGLIDLYGNPMTLTGGDLTLNSDIDASSDAGVVNVTGGNITLAGSNSFEGGLNVSGGTVTLDNADALASGNDLTLTNDGSVIANYNLALGGLDMSGPSSLALSENATIDSAGTHTIAGDISGNGGLTFDGGGEFVLSGDNDYALTTFLQDGTLTLGSDTALGRSNLVTLDAVVDYADGVDIASPIAINSGTTQFQVLSGSATQSGEISQLFSTRTFEKIGDGELVLTAYNTWTGETTVSDGTLTFDDGAAALASDMYVGRNDGDDATLRIENGGSVSNGIARIGDDAGAIGAVVVSGEGSEWTSDSVINAGESGRGELTIADGGEVSNSIGRIGSGTGSTGTVTVTGENSVWTNSDFLSVGTLGTATLTIENGGVVTSNMNSRIGDGFSSNGEATVTGEGSTLSTATIFAVGSRGEGSLVVSNGGTVTSGTAWIGETSNSTGDVTVTGSGSTWTNSTYLLVGNSGAGALTIADGGVVSADSVTIAAGSSSTGTLSIGTSDATAAMAGTLDSDTLAFGSGIGTLLFNHTNGGAGHAFGADISGGAVGNSLIRQLGGVTRLSGNNESYQGGLDVGGGTLIVDSVLGAGNVAGTVTNGGTLTGAGTVDGDVTIAGGGILAGQSGQTFTIGGDLALTNDALVNVALGAPGGPELFSVGGDLTLDGTLNVSDAGGFGPGLYTILNYGGSLSDNGLELGNVAGGPYLPGQVGLQTAVAGQVNLISRTGTDLVFWDGDAASGVANGAIDGGDGTWSATSQTFTDADGNVNGPAQPSPAFVGSPGHRARSLWMTARAISPSSAPSSLWTAMASMETRSPWTAMVTATRS